MNGRCKGDYHREFSCNANEGNSTVDYFIVSSELFENVSSFQVGEEEFSDHFPIECTLKFLPKSNHFINNDRQLVKRYDRYMYRWNENRRDDFLCNFQSSFTSFASGFNDTDINRALTTFDEIFLKAGKPMKITDHDKLNKKQIVIQPDWWDHNCQMLKDDKIRALRQFRNTNNDIDFIT